MNNAQAAKNGFKTFLVTLVISMTVFGLFYYFISTDTKEPDIEKETIGNVQNTKDTLANSSNTTDSPFENLSQAKVDIQKKVVLSESTQSTVSVPQTGSTGVTVGLMVSSVILAFGAYITVIGPRKKALERFEKRILNDLDSLAAQRRERT